ncbi:hypothetical protein COCOBI_05-5060 [Coccomyxa sp. Obi]|nr:hypothetical protein COCOBI_05-5060 [Coccomyxa sp. Obi]
MFHDRLRYTLQATYTYAPTNPTGCPRRRRRRRGTLKPSQSLVTIVRCQQKLSQYTSNQGYKECSWNACGAP